MRWRFTVAAGLVFLALLAWVITQERGRVAQEGEAFGLRVEQATKLQVKQKDKEDLLIEKSGDDWRLVKPIEGLADTEEVEGMVKAIAELKPTGSRKGQNLDSDDFGLKQPELTATLWYNGGRSVEVSLGAETPVGSARYAKIAGRDDLYIVSSYLRTTLSKEPEKLREEQLAKFEKDDVKGLSLMHGQTRIVCVKRGTEDAVEWRMTEPLNTGADEWNVKRLIDKVKDLKAEDFLREKKSDKELGLDKPQVKVAVDLTDGRKLTITLGKQTKQEAGDEDEEKEVVFARSSERKEVVLVNADVLGDLKKEVIDLRDKSVVQIDRDDVTRIWVERREGMTFKVARRPAGWWVEQPKQLEAKTSAVDDLLWDIEDLDAKKFVTEEAKPEERSQYGLAMPATAITVYLRGGKEPLKILIGSQTNEGDYYCMTSRSQQVVTISDFLTKDLPESIEDLKKSATDKTPEASFPTEEDSEE